MVTPRGAATTDTTAADFRKVRDSLNVVAHLLRKQSHHLGEAMELNEKLTEAVGKARTDLADAKTRVVTHAKAQQDLIDDLKAKLEAGPPGLTAEQGEALLASLQGLQTDAESIATDIPATDPPVATDNGETPVPVGGTPPG